MTDGSWTIFISIAVTFLFMLGVPVFLVIGYWVIGMSLVLGLPLINTGAALADVFTDGFALLAMPLFILTGDLINRSGIARRLSDFAYALLGWLRGGLAMASLGACGLFAAISGSNSATTATIGSMLHPEMVKGGYDERFSAATAAAGGTESRSVARCAKVATALASELMKTVPRILASGMKAKEPPPRVASSSSSAESSVYPKPKVLS